MRAVEMWVLGYVLNALWQVPLVFGAAWAAAWLVRRSGDDGAGVEHRMWVGALLLEAVLPGCRVDVGGVWHALVALMHWGSGAGDGAVRLAMGAGKAGGVGAMRLPEGVVAGVAMVFAGAVVYCAGRLAWGMWRTEGMRRAASPVRVDVADAGVCLMVSRLVSGPVTVGVWRAAVLLPVGFVESVEARDLEAVLAHEFAHVRRRDFAKNLAYGVVSLLGAWHPVVWMTRARVAESREMVCDAMAAEAVAGRERYARSLRLAAMLTHGSTARTLHAIGIFDANSFERRVMSLTMQRGVVRRTERLVVAAVCAAVALGTCATALGLRMNVAPVTVAAGSGRGSGEGLTVDPKVMAGQVLYKKVPVYPVEAKVNKNVIDGAVVLGVTIGKDGTIEDIHVVRSLREDYDRSALEAVREWRYKPYLLNGEPTEVETMVTVNYSTAR
jgi:TonB family protein